MGVVDNPFHIFCEVYDNGDPDSVLLTATVYDQRDMEQVKSEILQRLDRGRNEVFLSIDKEKLAMGDYRLDVVASNTTHTAVYSQTSRPFAIRWRGMPFGVNSLELAIEQLKYIARDAEFDSLKSAKTTAERQQAFLAFWKKRDPNPNTPRNERMEEYYRRVEYANRHFTHYRAGWKSDQGLVYIVLGPPSAVDRHPFDMNSKPYEVWTYYDINQSLIFIDETGFGDYRLVTPISEVYRYSQWR
jgi:GWxTD domain-containing protein